MDTYNILIIFIVFVLIHKIVALTIIFNLDIVQLRYLFNIIEPIFIIYFFSFLNTNNYIRLLLLLFLLAPINYWLFDKGLIYSIIDNNPQNNKIVSKIAFYGDSTINIIILLYTLFFLQKIFLNK
jgi:hypothetical protein